MGQVAFSGLIAAPKCGTLIGRGPDGKFRSNNAA